MLTQISSFISISCTFKDDHWTVHRSNIAHFFILLRDPVPIPFCVISVSTSKVLIPFDELNWNQINQYCPNFKLLTRLSKVNMYYVMNEMGKY